ncbi:hypothetical protein [Thermomonospora cellulosilytica]|uniref:Uncharacterized protein n=1 Tax=Thermomonospora cellulosilytica TaxID=1411118 RepID=A0A7W3MYM3_9ACTN|nr:hypothetical protein [Thermomonospora cellulosilytica]MBA9004296.1 hypothetical protein [Thermomonospora cellulosilytica]
MANRPAGTPIMLGLGVAVILGTNVALPAAAFADDPSASPSETSETSAEPTPEPSPPAEPTPTVSESEPTTPPPDPDPTTPSPDPTSSEPDPDPTSPTPTTPAPDPTSPSPDPTTPSPNPTSPGPTPTKPGTTPPPPGKDPTDPGDPPPGSTVAIKLSLSSPVASPGGTLTATAHLRSGRTAARDVRLTLSGSGFTVKQCTLWTPCKLGSVNGKGRAVPVTVYVPGNARPGSHITVYATVTAAQSKPQTASVAFGVADGTGVSTVLPPTPPGGVPAPLAMGDLPQVALPPVASPQLAPGLMIVSPVAALRHDPGDGDEWAPVVQRIAAVQAGWLAALLTSTSLLLTSLRLSPYRRTGKAGPGRALRVDRDVRARLNGKRPTAARLRTLPPLPAQPPKPRPRIRLAWLPPRPTPPIRHSTAGT